MSILCVLRRLLGSGFGGVLGGDVRRNLMEKFLEEVKAGQSWAARAQARLDEEEAAGRRNWADRARERLEEEQAAGQRTSAKFG